MPKLTTGLAATPEQREALLEWVRAEGLDPAEIADDGTFWVHYGRVSGHKFLFDEEGKRLWNRKRTEPVKVFFRQPQKNPLPEVLGG